MKIRQRFTVGVVLGSLALVLLGVIGTFARSGPVVAQSSSCAGQVSTHSVAPVQPAFVPNSRVGVSVQVRRLSSAAPGTVQLTLEIQAPNGSVAYDSIPRGENQIVDISGGGIYERQFDWLSSSGSAPGTYKISASVRNAGNSNDVCDATWPGAWGGAFPQQTFHLTAVPALLTPTPSPLPPTDDHGDGITSATPVSVGESYSGDIESGGDMDLFSFQAEGGTSYVIETFLGSLQDTYLDPYDSTSMFLATNDDWSGIDLASRIEWTAPSSGTYYAAVNAYDASMTGSYAFSVSVGTPDPGTPTPPPPMDDHGDRISSATPISVDSSDSGSIEPGGDIDFFGFQAEGGIPYIIETSLGSLSDTYLELYDSAGTTLDSNDDWIDLESRIEWTAPSSATYYASVRAYDSSMTGSYGLSVSIGVPPTATPTPPPSTDDHGNSIFSATPISVDVSYPGFIETGGDIDFFGFHAEGGTPYIIQTSLDSLSDTYLYLHDSSGATLDTNDDWFDLASQIEWTAPSSGTYYAAVAAYDSSMTGSYSFTVSPGEPPPSDDHGNSISSATPISVDASVSGIIEASGDIDFFLFQAQAGTPYFIETSLGSLFDTYLYLYDSSGATLDTNDDWIDLESRIEWTALSSGTYYAAVSAYGSSPTGSYGLSVSAGDPPPSDDHGNSISSATPILVDASVSGNIESGGDIDVFAFPALGGTSYVIQTSLASLSDTYLYLYDSSGDTLDSNDDWIDLSSQIEWTAPASDTHYAAVRAYDHSMTGSYGFSVSAGEPPPSDDHGNSISSATPISVDASVSGIIEASGDIDFFSFQAQAGTPYVIQTSLVSLSDTYLYLYGSSGDTLESNDDWRGIELSSQIEWTAPTSDTYYAAVRAYDSSMTGSYGLSVSEAAAPGLSIHQFVDATQVAIGSEWAYAMLEMTAPLDANSVNITLTAPPGTRISRLVPVRNPQLELGSEIALTMVGFVPVTGDAVTVLESAAAIDEYLVSRQQDVETAQISISAGSFTWLVMFEVLASGAGQEWLMGVDVEVVDQSLDTTTASDWIILSEEFD